MHRYRSQARLHAGRSPSYFGNSGEPVLPLHKTNSNPSKPTNQSGGLDGGNDGNGSLPASNANLSRGDSQRGPSDRPLAPPTDNINNAEDAVATSDRPAAPPPDKSEAARDGGSALETIVEAPAKPNIPTRMKNGCIRGFIHLKNALFHSWVNVLLVFVPIGIAMEAIHAQPGVVFAINAIAIIPLAGLLTYATEAVASRLGDTLGALLNVSFGNAVELIIFIIALVKNEIAIVQASLIGSILSNLLLILGMAFLLGGLRFREQVYNNTVTQMSACLLSLSVMSLLLPTAFHATFAQDADSLKDADNAVLPVSRGTSVILLLVYILYLLFQLKSHSYMYESTPQEIIDEESHPGVLHDMLNSSSSDDSSSSDSSDSDTSNSGSVLAAGKRMRKKMFKRHRRRSNASASSTTASSVDMSAISSPSSNGQRDGFFNSTNPSSRKGSQPGLFDDVETPTDPDMQPRVRDFVRDSEGTLPQPDDLQTDLQTDEPKKHKSKKHHKKHHRHRKEKRGKKDAHDPEKSEPDAVKQPTPRVGFSEEIETIKTEESPAENPGKLGFNMRQLSSRTAFRRPGLAKMLSNNVFTQANATPPQPPPQPQPARAQPNGLRRTASLPSRMTSTATPQPGPAHATTEPIPPYQHLRQPLSKVKSEDVDGSEADSGSDHLELSRTAAVILLLASTALVAVCAEFMVDAIPQLLENQSAVGQTFIGLIILPIVSNAAEHVTAVTVAAKNKMDLAIGVAVGSSIQIALFVTPVVVLLGWILGKDMSLYFTLFEVVSLFVTAFVINFLILDGRSNYLEGSLLIAAYIIIALVAFYYPEGSEVNPSFGGAS